MGTLSGARLTGNVYRFARFSVKHNHGPPDGRYRKQEHYGPKTQGIIHFPHVKRHDRFITGLQRASAHLSQRLRYAVALSQ